MTNSPPYNPGALEYNFRHLPFVLDTSVARTAVLAKDVMIAQVQSAEK